MANAMGGILQGLMSGWDQQNEINRRKALDAEARAERERQRGRQNKADAREELTFGQGQEDRTHALARRPVLEQREDEEYGLNRAVRGMQVERGRMELDRLPTKYAQEDAQFDLEQRGRRQSIAESGQRMSINGMRMELERMGLDEKRLEMGMARARDAVGRGLAIGMQTGNWEALARAHNSTIGQMVGSEIIGIDENHDGSFAITLEGGKSYEVPSRDALIRATAAAIDPQVVIKAAYDGMKAKAEAEAARAKNPKSFTELVRGDDGALQQFDYQTGRTSQVLDQAGQPASGTLAGRDREGTPAQIAAKFYADQVDGGARANDAAEATSQYMRRAYPQADGWWAPRRVDPQWGDEGAAPPPRFAQPSRAPAPRSAQPPQGGHGRVVRTGTRDGVRVAQYEDGTILPVQ